MFSPLTCGKNQPVPAFYETGVSLFSGILHAPSGEHPSYIIGHLVSGDVLQYTIRDAGYVFNICTITHLVFGPTTLYFTMLYFWLRPLGFNTKLDKVRDCLKGGLARRGLTWVDSTRDFCPRVALG